MGQEQGESFFQKGQARGLRDEDIRVQVASPLAL